MAWSWKIGAAGCGLAAAGWLVGAATAIGQDSKDGKRANDQELELVKKVYESRDGYQASLERLRAFYIHTSNEENRQWVEKELTEYHLMVKSPFILDLDLPAADLKPDASIPKANRLLREAIEWKEKRSLMDRDRGENLKRAELLLRRLLNDYKRSDRISEACYHLGDIYASKYFQQYRRAVAFYERSFLYQPNTSLDSRLKAAGVYDRYLSDRRRAIELYQEVLGRETEPTQTKEARRRLDDLLGTRTSAR